MTLECLGIVALSLIAGVALAAAAGFRAFLPLLVLSAAAHLGLLIPPEAMRFLESDTALIALAVAAELSGRSDAPTQWGAIVWFTSRWLYLPLYLFGVEVWRSLVWFIGACGLAAMLIGVLL